MRALYYDGQLQYREAYSRPVRGPGEALIQVKWAGICNTDKEIIKGYKGYRGVLGHEFVGVVVEADDPVWIGRRVVADINVGCGICRLCKKGKAHHCWKRRCLGIFGMDGAFADYLSMPVENLFVVPDRVSDREAVFAEPLAAALEIVEQIHVRPSQRVAVLGDGKLGQLVALVLSLTGCRLTVIGKHPDRLQLLQGRAETKCLSEVDVEAEEWAASFDLVVDCSGQPSGLLLASALTEPGGVLLMKSTFQGDNTVCATDWVVRELTLTGSRCGPMDAALRLLERRLVDVLPLISSVYSLPDGVKAVFDQQAGKVLLDMGL
ncbi:MAG TPA: alcohol dehydrogenase catalytic domain-containing protein [Patescibacteria group bacterium]|nr:alcohol dehydrogenase catalytic domain-containing protein [Patescibacteria group bacterium]